jgi:hypothetical protein
VATALIRYYRETSRFRWSPDAGDQLKVGRNAECPCGSGDKYKHCCLGRVPWDDIISHGDPQGILHFCARGKNRAFLNMVAGILQLDRLDGRIEWRDIKKGCTDQAIRDIHLAVANLWPDLDDLVRVLAAEKDTTSGLYIGSYEPEQVFEGVSRHAIYSDAILLFDPFLDARNIKREHNPLEHPSRFRAMTLKHLRLWFEMAPWIEAGLVRFVRNPNTLDPELWRLDFALQSKKVDTHPELDELIRHGADDKEAFEWVKEYMFLSTPDDQLATQYLEKHPASSHLDIQEFMREIDRARGDHPYFVRRTSEELQKGELFSWSTGASYTMAKLTAGSCGAHLITNLPSKWKEVEIDRANLGVELGNWTSFSKAFQSVEFKFLNRVPLRSALRLRQGGRLDSMRSFLRRTWRTAREPNELSEESARNLSDELGDRIAEAEHEWREINVDLSKWLGADAVLAGALGAPQIATGNAAWLAGLGFAVAAAAISGSAWYKKRTLVDRYPAAFFLDLKRENERSD